MISTMERNMVKEIGTGKVQTPQDMGKREPDIRKIMLIKAKYHTVLSQDNEKMQ